MIVRVDSRIRLPESGLTKEVARDLRVAFEHANPKFHKARNMGFKTKEKPTIRTWERDDDELTFPRGGMGRVREHVPGPFDVRDERFGGDPSVGAIPAHRLELYPFQERCVGSMLRTEQGVIGSPTGSGKSTMLLAAASRAGLPSLVVVPSAALFSQWIERARKELGLREDEVGAIRGKTRRVRPFTVAVWKTLDNLSDAEFARHVGGVFGAVFFDEVHKFGAGSFYRVGDRCPARYRIGVSDDETRADGTDFLVYDVAGDVLERVDEEQLIADGFVHDVPVVLVPTESEVDWYRRQLLFQAVLRREGAVEALAAVRADWPEASLDGLFRERAAHKNLFGDAVDELSRDPARNALASGLALRMVEAGHRVLVYVGRTDHARRLRGTIEESGTSCGLLVGEEPAEFEASVRALKAGELSVAVANFQAAGTGLDVPSVDRGVCAMPFSSRQIFRQLRGRFCRIAAGKSDSRLYYLLDEHVFGKKARDNMRRWNRTCLVVQEDGTETEV